MSVTLRRPTYLLSLIILKRPFDVYSQLLDNGDVSCATSYSRCIAVYSSPIRISHRLGLIINC